MASVFPLLGLFCIFGAAAVAAAGCDDIDTKACVLLSQHQDICAEQTLAMSTCPRYCKLCPLECYHCEQAVNDFQLCNATKRCAMNESCMLKTLKSSRDGHMEYEMSCEANEACDGFGLGFSFGKRDLESRDLSVHCCTTDLCNTPSSATTTMPTTPTTAMPTAPPTTTRPTGCARDIEFVLDKTRSVSPSEFSDETQFVRQLINKLNVGPQDSLVGLATFDSNVYKEWNLNSHQTKQSVLQDLESINYHYSFSGGNSPEEALEFLVNYAFQSKNGDRPSYPDVVIMITDGTSTHESLLRHDASNLHHVSGDVIAIGIGRVAMSDVYYIATDRAHTFHLQQFSSLLSASFINKVYNLICAGT